MEELLRRGDSLSSPPGSQPLILSLQPPASPLQKAFHPLGGACSHTQPGLQLAREYQGTLYPDTVAVKVGINSPGSAGVMC